MLPVYVGTLEEVPFEVKDPPSLTDGLSEAEQESLENWATSLGTTTSTTVEAHQSSTPHDSETVPDNAERAEDVTEADTTTESSSPGDTDEESLPDDDPMEWIKRDINKMDESSDSQ
jgi:hypothetical protein